jgi:hypothetical protein
VVAQAWLWWADRPTHKVLPIFTPVSLEYERAMRKAPGRSADEAVQLATALADEPGLDPALAPDVARLKELRLRLLDLSNRRHALNTRLMQLGVDLGAELDADQWAVVTMQRDQLRKEKDAAVFDRVLRRLSGGGGEGDPAPAPIPGTAPAPAP